jgi:hypothetical protein
MAFHDNSIIEQGDFISKRNQLSATFGALVD